MDWDSLVTMLNGHYEPGAYDIRGPAPRATALAGLIADLAAGREPAQPVLASHGWWRRQERFSTVPREDTYPSAFPPTPVAMRSRARLSARRPILITGGGGTLATAFERICHTRGLCCEALSREGLDIADQGSLVSILQRLQPWAIVNCADYVGVDDAELEAERCRQENIVGPQVLAEACAAHGLRLMTFSSDLVFDGSAVHPYVESDAVAPLSTYGRMKAHGEQAVLALHPDALIARTSAFFGPWDEENVVHLALTAFASGDVWAAPSDRRLSLTYVPDLVHASLDLLIDGAHGLWHLANDGDVSWAELTRRVAVASGYSDDLVDECLTAALGLRAVRPLYSVLGTERGQILPSLDDALRRCLRERQRPGAEHPRPSHRNQRSKDADGAGHRRPRRGTAA
jgi:dTDP-4-dehydrorhamnose reductase